GDTTQSRLIGWSRCSRRVPSLKSNGSMVLCTSTSRYWLRAVEHVNVPNRGRLSGHGRSRADILFWNYQGGLVVHGERSDGIFRRSPEESKSAEERVESDLDSCRLGHLGSHVVRLGSGRRSTIAVPTS